MTRQRSASLTNASNVSVSSSSRQLRQRRSISSAASPTTAAATSSPRKRQKTTPISSIKKKRSKHDSSSLPTFRVELPKGPTGLTFAGKPPRITHISSSTKHGPVPSELCVGQMIREFELKDCWKETDLDAEKLTTMAELCQMDERILLVVQPEPAVAVAKQLPKAPSKRASTTKQSSTTTRTRTSPRKRMASATKDASINTALLAPPAMPIVSDTAVVRPTMNKRPTRRSAPALVSLVSQAAILESQKERLERFKRDFPLPQQEQVRQICLGPRFTKGNNADESTMTNQGTSLGISSTQHDRTTTTVMMEEDASLTTNDESQINQHEPAPIPKQVVQGKNNKQQSAPVDRKLPPVLDSALQVDERSLSSSINQDDDEAVASFDDNEVVPIQHVTTTPHLLRKNPDHQSPQQDAPTHPISLPSFSTRAQILLTMIWDEMRLHCSTDQMQKTTLGVLSKLLDEAKSWTLSELHAHLPELVSAMQRFPHDTDVHDKACQVILACAESDANQRSLESNKEDVLVIINILKSLPTHHNLQSGLMDVLFNACQHSTSIASVFIQNDGIKVCVDAMKQFGGDSHVEEVACSLIFTLINTKSECTRLFWEADGMETLLAGSMTDEAQQLVQTTIMQSMGDRTIFVDILQSGTLNNVVRDFPSLTVSVGGIESCIDILNDSLASRETHEQACHLLKQLATIDTSLSKEIKEKNGLQALSHLLWLYDGEDIAREALSVLNILSTQK